MRAFYDEQLFIRSSVTSDAKHCYYWRVNNILNMRAFLAIGIVAIGLTFLACDSNTETTTDDNITPLRFDAKAGFVSRFDEYEVDTAGVYFDKPILTSRVEVQETIKDTGLTYQGKSGVSRHVIYYPVSGRRDTAYYCQEANGDLYRYNYGFSLLNNFADLVAAIGQPIDMGWVLVAKFGKKEGATWVAKDSSLTVQFLGKPVFFKSNATMLADTSIVVGTETISCRQAEHVITATASIASANDVNGIIRARTYISAKYGKVVLDFVKSGNFTGIYTGKVRGVYKVMTSHE